jgi:epoxyqueuosine reductase
LKTPPPSELTNALKAQALAAGFDMAGVCPAATPEGLPRLRQWLERGYAGQMDYIADRLDAYADPARVLEGVRSIVMLATHYRTKEPEPTPPGAGRVSRYAWGEADYHDVIHQRLRKLAGWLSEHSPAARVRGVVDSAPLMEREFAREAGLGWIGKNTLLLNQHVGSYFFLAALLTDLELAYDAPQAADHCGTCRACLDACPTQAFPQGYVLDATRCISYLTIELKGPIDPALRASMGDWLFGCDVCQDVCPWNRRAPQSQTAEFWPQAQMNPLDAAELFELDEAAFRARFRHTPLFRAKRRGFLRNAAIVLGNNPGPRSLAALTRGLNDEEPLVRGACAWALGRQSSPDAALSLRTRREIEGEASVLKEIDDSLAGFWHSALIASDSMRDERR